MNYLKLLKARGKTGQVPTMAGRQWTRQEQNRIDEGRCVLCGARPWGASSYACPDCEADAATIDDIRDEIRTLRDQLLKSR